METLYHYLYNEIKEDRKLKPDILQTPVVPNKQRKIYWGVVDEL